MHFCNIKFQKLCEPNERWIVEHILLNPSTRISYNYFLKWGRSTCTKLDLFSRSINWIKGYINICITAYTYSYTLRKFLEIQIKNLNSGWRILSMGQGKTSFTCIYFRIVHIFFSWSCYIQNGENLQIFVIVCYLKLREKLKSKRRKSSVLVSDCFISIFLQSHGNSPMCLWHS